MKRKFLCLLALYCSLTFSASAQILNQRDSMQTAAAWISGLFAAKQLQSFSVPNTRVIHQSFFGGAGNPYGINARWSFVLSGTESSNNLGSDFQIWNYTNDGYWFLNPLSISRATGAVSINNNLFLNNATNNLLVFNPTGLNPPTFKQRGVGSKIVLWNSAMNDTLAAYDIGMENWHMWFGVPYSKHTTGFKFYGGTTQIGRIDGTGSSEWTGQGRFKGWYSSGTGPAAEIGYYNGRATIIGSDRGIGTTSYVPLFLAGGTSPSDYKSMIITNTGVGINIGAGIPQSELAVNGTITAKKIKVTQTGWPDYVFGATYHLPALEVVEQYIHAHQHLEGIPAARIVEKEGMDVGEMNKKLLEKIEELTLYLIEQNKRIKELEEWKKEREGVKN